MSLNRLSTSATTFAAIAGIICGCGTETSAETYIAPAESAVMGPDWFKERAQVLGISEVEAISRDQEMHGNVPERLIWDSHLQGTSAALWADQCARCHGVGGNFDAAETHDPAPRQWGAFSKKTLFFLMSDKLRLMLFDKIEDGGCIVNGKVSAMPAFGDTLSNEQIWGLIWYFESV